MIKTSKELNKLLDKLIKLDNGNGFLDINADHTVYGYHGEGESEGVEAGIRLHKQAIKLNKPIYCCWNEDVGYYFVNDIAAIKALLKTAGEELVKEQKEYLAQQSVKEEIDKENRIKILEGELKKLKQDQK